jgi:hypothetical protein
MAMMDMENGDRICWDNILIMQRIKDESARRYSLEATMRLDWTNPIGVATYQLYPQVHLLRWDR